MQTGPEPRSDQGNYFRYRANSSVYSTQCPGSHNVFRVWLVVTGDSQVDVSSRHHSPFGWFSFGVFPTPVCWSVLYRTLCRSPSLPLRSRLPRALSWELWSPWTLSSGSTGLCFRLPSCAASGSPPGREPGPWWGSPLLSPASQRLLSLLSGMQCLENYLSYCIYFIWFSLLMFQVAV